MSRNGLSQIHWRLAWPECKIAANRNFYTPTATGDTKRSRRFAPALSHHVPDSYTQAFLNQVFLLQNGPAGAVDGFDQGDTFRKRRAAGPRTVSVTPNQNAPPGAVYVFADF